MENDLYYNKYLKYKIKYINLKKKMYNLKGGAPIKKDLYLFKATWCPHCQSFKSEWDKLLQDKELNKKINFITYDSVENKNEINKFKIQGYPTILLGGNGRLVEYEGPRTYENLKKFLITN